MTPGELADRERRKQAFVEDNKHLLFGLCLDCLTNGVKGGDFSMKVQLMQTKVKGLLDGYFEQVSGPIPITGKPGGK